MLLRSCNSLMFNTQQEVILLIVMVFSNGLGFNKFLNGNYFLIEDPIYIINCTNQKMTLGLI